LIYAVEQMVEAALQNAPGKNAHLYQMHDEGDISTEHIDIERSTLSHFTTF
jgi:hypothetical protein